MPNLNDSFIKSTFENESFPGYEGTILDWNATHRFAEDPVLLKKDHYTLRLDTFYSFNPSLVGSHPYLSDVSLSGRVYNESNYIASIDGSPKVVSIEEGLVPIDIKAFPFSIEDDLSNGATGIEFIARSLIDKSNVLDMRLVAEWWHWTVPGLNNYEPSVISSKDYGKSAFWQVATKNISENLYLSKPIISFPEDTIRPMEIYSKAHLVSGSEDGSSILNAYSGWDKVAGVWFDENVDIQYSGKDKITRTPSGKAESYSIYEVPDSGYQHYENEIYTQYRIVYSGEPSDKYKDEREISFTKSDRTVASVERKITRASSSGDFFDDWDVLSESATSPFVDSEIFSDYVSENIPVEEEDVYEVVPYTGNIAEGEDYVEIDIIPYTGWGENADGRLPYCMKEDELFFRDGCNLRMRQEGGWHEKRKSFFSEVMVYFQDTNSFPISGYKVEFQSAPPDESRIYQLQNVADGLSDLDEVYFVGQAKGEGGSVGEAVYDSELFSIPQTDYEVEQGISPSSSESSRKLNSAVGFSMGQSIPRGELIVPRIVTEEEYSSHTSGQKYIISPHGAYSEYRSAKSFSSAGVLYSNFGDISFQNDTKGGEQGYDPKVDTYALYEQKLNIENKIYSKDEKEIRIFESGACDGFSLIGRELREGERDVFAPLEVENPSWRINIKEENGQELGIRTGIISCEPQDGENGEDYFFSSNSGGGKDRFLGHGRLNYFLNKEYVTGVNGDVLQAVVYPDEKVELDLPKNLFEGDSVYYVERDVYVDSSADSQANYIEPEISLQNKLSPNIKNDTPYLTQTFHQIKKKSVVSTLPEFDDFLASILYNREEWEIHSSSPLTKKEYFNLQLKTKESLDDTNSKNGCVDLNNPIELENNENYLVIPETNRNEGCMLQRSEGKYFPSSAGTIASGTSMVFTGLTVGHYYELQKKNSSSWQTNLKPTTNYPNNKPDEASEISLVVEDGETYRLKEWKKQFSYGEVAEEIKTKLVTEGAAVEYRLVKLRYTFKNRERLCNWIINKNTFTNSNMIHAEALASKAEPVEEGDGFNSAIAGYWDLLDWLYSDADGDLMKSRYKNFINTAAYTQPSNPHITRNMEGTPFRSLRDFESLDELPQYEFNGLRLPYYLEAKIGDEKNKRREKGGDQIVGEKYSYSDFSRLRITRYIYRVYKKNAVLLGDLAKRDGVRDYGGWDFGLEKSIKSNGVWGSWQSANILSERKISSNYYAAAQLGLPYYSKGFDRVDSDNTNFDSGSVLDAVMLETDETANYEPKDIRFRINKEQIIETDSECKVQSKYNFFPVNLSWDYLKGAFNLTDGLEWDAAGYQKITLADTSTYSYAIVKAVDEEVQLLNSDNEIKIYRMEEQEIAAPQYSNEFECEAVGGKWNANLGACQIKVSRKDKGSALKPGEPTLIEGVTELKIISDKASGSSIETKIKRLPLSYTIKQKAEINGVPKITHEEEVQGYNINSVRIGESGDEIYALASDFECMNDDGSLVTYEVTPITGAIDSNAPPFTSSEVTVAQDDNFYNSPFQTSDFTVSGDNNIGGVFVCSGQSAITVKADTERTFHVVNAPGAQTVTVRDIEGVSISALAAGEGARFKFNEGAWVITNKDVAKLTRASSQNDAVLSDYSEIIGESSFKLIEDENIYLEQSDNDEQIVFDCLSKVNLPLSPTAFSFTGINIATEPIPMASPNNHLINGELVHYMKPRSEVRVSYANSAFSVETLELESQAAKSNINQSLEVASHIDKFEIKDGGATIKGIYVTNKPSLEVSVPSLTNGFKHAFVIKKNKPDSNNIIFRNSDGDAIGQSYSEYGVILKHEGGKNVFESITAPRPKLGIKEGEDNVVVNTSKSIDWQTYYNTSYLSLNYLKIDEYTPEIVEYDASAFVGSGQHFFIKNETKEVKQIKLFNGDQRVSLASDSGEHQDKIPVERNGVTRVDFFSGAFINFGPAQQVTNYKINNVSMGKVHGGNLRFLDNSPVDTLDNGLYHFGSNITKIITKGEIEEVRFVIPGAVFKAEVVPVVKFSSTDDFKVIVIPDSPFHEEMSYDTYWPYKDKDGYEVSFTKDERYILDYSNASNGLKVCTVPVFDPSYIDRELRHDPSVNHEGKPIDDSYHDISDLHSSVGPYFDDSGEGEDRNVASSIAISYEVKSGEIVPELLLAKALVEDSQEDTQSEETYYVVVSEEKIVRIVDDRIEKIDLTKVETSTILIIYERPGDEEIGIITDDSSDPTLMNGRSAMKAVYSSGSYTLTKVQFYEVVYPSFDEPEPSWWGYRELNKFYEKSDYNGKVLLFNASVEITEDWNQAEGGSTATKWIDKNKYKCNDESVGQITYAYSTDPANNKYSILDSSLYVESLPSGGYIVNKSNTAVNIGEDVLYSDEVWSSDSSEGFLPSLNIRSEDYFIKLYNHTVTPKAYSGKDEQKEIVNFCRLNKLSPRSKIGLNKNGDLFIIENERGESQYGRYGGWPEVEPYKYGITLYGNQLNSNKKINFEFNYYDLWENGEGPGGLKAYNDLIYGKRIPSRALANAIGFSINTGNESIIKCIFFNERTGEITFSGINKGEEYVVLARDYKTSTSPIDFIADQGDNLEEAIPYVIYNGDKYLNGETFIGKGDVSTYSISSLDFANVKVSLLSDLIEKKEDGSKVDPVVHPEAETATVGGEVVAESAWRAMPEDNKTITVNDDYEDGASYITGSIWNIVSNESDTAVVGEVYSFSNGANFIVDMIAGTTYLYGTLVGGNISSGDIGAHNLSKEIKESNRWGTIIKSSEMLSGYRWSNFLVSHSFNHKKVQDLIDGDGYEDKYYFITIKKQPGETYSPVIDEEWATLIKTAEDDSNNLYILRRAAKGDPPFNKHNKIEGIDLSEPSLPDGIARVKIGKKDIFVPDNGYPIITTDNQAFKDEISMSESRAAEASRKVAPVVRADLQTELVPKVQVVSAEDVLDNKNRFYKDVALNPTKNYANQVGLPGGIIFYLGEGNETTDKLRVRLSRLVSKRVVLKDYSNNLRVQNLKNNGIVHQLKYILEGEIKSAYAYDEMVYKGTVNIKSALWKLSDITIGTSTINADGLYDGDAIVFSVWSGNTDLQTNKVYFIKLTTPKTYNLYRAEKLTTDFKETFSNSSLTAAEFRVVNKATTSEDKFDELGVQTSYKFSAIGNISEYVIVNGTCFRNHTLSGGTYIKLGLETYSFEYREDSAGDVNQGGPVSVDYVEDIFDSRNNLVRNWYVLKYHKNNKKTVTLHLTKGRTYRYFIKSNVNKIVYGPNNGDKLEALALGTKGTFEAKQEQVDIVFNTDTEIRPITKQGQDVIAGKVVTYSDASANESPPPLEVGRVEKVGNVWSDYGLVNGEYKNNKVKCS